MLSFQTNCAELFCFKGYTGLSKGVVVLDGTNCGLGKVRRYSQPDPASVKANQGLPHAFMGRGEVLGIQVTGMIEWSQKSRPKKILRASSKTPKNTWTKN